MHTLQAPILLMFFSPQHNYKPRNKTKMKRTNKQFSTIIKAVLLFVLGMAAAITASAQNANTSAVQTANLNLNDAIELSFVNGGGGTVNFAFTNATELINGKESITQDIRVRSNKKFKVAVSSSTANFTYTGTSIVNNILPVSTGLKVMVTSNNTGGYMTLSALLGWLGVTFGNSTTLLTYCDPGGNQTFTVKYKATPGILAAPGTYTTDVIFTATQM